MLREELELFFVKSPKHYRTIAALRLSLANRLNMLKDALPLSFAFSAFDRVEYDSLLEMLGEA